MGDAARTSPCAVLRGFQPAERRRFQRVRMLARPADLEIGDTADWEVCGTFPDGGSGAEGAGAADCGGADFPVRRVAGLPACGASAVPTCADFRTPRRFGNRRHSRLGSLRYVSGRRPYNELRPPATTCVPRLIISRARVISRPIFTVILRVKIIRAAAVQPFASARV